MQRSSSLAPSARATRHGHARACRPSHAAARELFGDMRRSPGGEELDDHEAVWIWWQQTRHPSRAHGLSPETWQMGAEAYGLFGGAPCTPSRFQRRTRPAPSWQLRFKAATREWITFGEHTRFARRCKGSRMSAQPQGTVPGRAPSTTMNRNHAPLASS